MDFKKEFLKALKEIDPNWNIVGAISENKDVFTFGTDTKVLSTLFELVVYPVVKKVADSSGMKVELSEAQNIYPDFTLYKNKADKNKIAVDVKTTYMTRYKKSNKIRPFGFTLGSYTSFIRNNTKNILYPYNQYKEHWIIGFVYERDDDGEPQKLKIKDLGKVSPPYKEVKFFVQQKYKIAGDRPGSGNTANIGSIRSSNIEDFDKGKGPFSKHGKKVFVEYWSNYDRFKPRKYTNLEKFFEWKKNH